MKVNFYIGLFFVCIPYGSASPNPLDTLNLNFNIKDKEDKVIRTGDSVDYSEKQLTDLLEPVNPEPSSKTETPSQFNSTDECQNKDTKGADYLGSKSESKSGHTCEKWSNQQQRKWWGIGDHNYCRNTDGTSGVWCYISSTVDGFASSNQDNRWELCDVPLCDLRDPWEYPSSANYDSPNGQAYPSYDRGPFDVDYPSDQDYPGVDTLGSHVAVDMCTGDYFEPASARGNKKDTPPSGTECVEFNNKTCHPTPGRRWGSSLCYTDAEGSNWGAECVPCSASVCPENKFKCLLSGVCIWGRCNGSPDCDDGSDEENCKDFVCPEEWNDLKCLSGQCIQCFGYGKCNRVCDGVSDCPDGSDEHNCTNNVCNENSFRCQSGQCIGIGGRCDGNTFHPERDCSDESDEENCKDYVCPGNTFKCLSSGVCQPQYYRCNGSPNCDDGSDEENCKDFVCPKDLFGWPMYKCSNGQCIESHKYQNKVCNGVSDCHDGSDEQNCTNIVCPEDQFRCQLGKCIPITSRCNGQKDCRDESDEDNCKDIVCNKAYALCHRKDEYSRKLIAMSKEDRDQNLLKNCESQRQGIDCL